MAGEWRSIPAHSGLPKINLLLTSDPGGEWPWRHGFGVFWSYGYSMVSLFSLGKMGEPRT